MHELDSLRLACYLQLLQLDMHSSIFLLLAVATWNSGTVALATPSLVPLQFPLFPPIRGGISEDVYSELLLFAKYSSAVYQSVCPRPLGHTLVESVRYPHGASSLPLLR